MPNTLRYAPYWHRQSYVLVHLFVLLVPTNLLQVQSVGWVSVAGLGT